MRFQPVPGLCVLVIILFSLVSCDRPKPAVVEGVSIELAKHRAARISNIRYRLRFDIPEAINVDIRGFVAITFELADVASELQIDFREAGDKVKQCADFEILTIVSI